MSTQIAHLAPRRAQARGGGDRAAAGPYPHRGAAGKLTIGFWDHWVPAGNDVMRKQVEAWADKNKVDVQPTSSPPTATRTC